MHKLWKIDYAAVHDGPGVRTSFYYKGCPLRCLWCSNPEGQTSSPDLVFEQARCIGCGLCEDACHNKAVELRKNSDTRKIHINRTACDLCGECSAVCATKALEIWGRAYPLRELLEITEKNRLLYRKTGGGVTLTGGDPVCQLESVLELLDQCRERGIHTAMETSAHADMEGFERILEKIDWLFIDIKHMDPEEHRRVTGKRNNLILQNVRRASMILGRRHRDLVIRMVVVPGINNGENILRAAEFLGSLPHITGVQFLPYHDYGVVKYGLLDRSYPLQGLKPPSEDMMEGCRKIMTKYGLKQGGSITFDESCSDGE